MEGRAHTMIIVQTQRLLGIYSDVPKVCQKPTQGTARKSHRTPTATRHQENN